MEVGTANFTFATLVTFSKYISAIDELYPNLKSTHGFGMTFAGNNSQPYGWLKIGFRHCMYMIDPQGRIIQTNPLFSSPALHESLWQMKTLSDLVTDCIRDIGIPVSPASLDNLFKDMVLG